MLLEYSIYPLLIITAYLLGSIPSAVWIGKRFYGVDVREHGSKNAGATNVLRVLGRRAALPVFIIDGLKGYVSVMLSWIVTMEPFGMIPYSEGFIYLRLTLIVASILGHIFPIFAGFRGGKGVATIAGCMIAFAPLPITLSLVTFFVVLAISKYVSLASMIASGLFPVYMILTPLVSRALNLNDIANINDVLSPTMIISGCIAGGAIIFMHRKNIARLRAGTESKTYLRRPKRT